MQEEALVQAEIKHFPSVCLAKLLNVFVLTLFFLLYRAHTWFVLLCAVTLFF